MNSSGSSSRTSRSGVKSTTSKPHSTKPVRQQ
jgi:hypothetical protein